MIMSTTHLFRTPHSAFALADVFEKNEKRNKTTSVYRLELTRLTATGIFDVSVFTEAFKFSWHVYALFILSAWVLSAFVYIWKICMLYSRFYYWQPALTIKIWRWQEIAVFVISPNQKFYKWQCILASSHLLSYPFPLDNTEKKKDHMGVNKRPMHPKQFQQPNSHQYQISSPFF